MKFRELFDRAAIAALIAIAGWVGTEIRELSNSVSTLNTNVAVIIAAQGFQKEQLDLQSTRILQLEQIVNELYKKGE